ncbi:hypothetical protein [Burkholderia sp. 9120]|uniref:hypothetical protein n=1 Tax=Burkholderia sp. 9120 TaxID=1500897 RepID=UPI001E59C9BF|nr:hypothetical protein [Burkholderia sp. 9120]
MLLPHPAAYVREQSLRWHLALAAFRTGKGNGDLLAELVKALYLAWYLQQAGFGAANQEMYLEAERILDDAARNAGKNIWLIESADCLAITRLLDLHEQQLSNAPVYVIAEARQRVLHFGKGNRRSPW